MKVKWSIDSIDEITGAVEFIKKHNKYTVKNSYDPCLSWDIKVKNFSIPESIYEYYLLNEKWDEKWDEYEGENQLLFSECCESGMSCFHDSVDDFCHEREIPLPKAFVEGRSGGNLILEGQDYLMDNKEDIASSFLEYMEGAGEYPAIPKWIVGTSAEEPAVAARDMEFHRLYLNFYFESVYNLITVVKFIDNFDFTDAYLSELAHRRCEMECEWEEEEAD